MTPVVVAKWPPKVTVVYGGPNAEAILQGTFVLSLWPIMGPPVLLHVESMQGTPSDTAKAWYHKPGKVPMAATLLPRDKEPVSSLVPMPTAAFRPPVGAPGLTP